MTLQQKNDLEGRMEEIMKTEESTEERAMKSPKDKDDIDTMVQKTLNVVQQL
jgi:hypothetical protein